LPVPGIRTCDPYPDGHRRGSVEESTEPGRAVVVTAGELLIRAPVEDFQVLPGRAPVVAGAWTWWPCSPRVTRSAAATTGTRPPQDDDRAGNACASTGTGSRHAAHIERVAHRFDATPTAVALPLAPWLLLERSEHESAPRTSPAGWSVAERHRPGGPSG
jgi:hypothetical protein